MALFDFMAAQPGSEGISGLDPGKLQFLAQIGASLDPEGFAGGVGGATSQQNNSRRLLLSLRQRKSRGLKISLKLLG